MQSETRKEKVALLAITKHGVEQAMTLAAQMPEAEIVTSEKFADAVQSLPNTRHIYQGALTANVEAVFNTYDQLICFVSLGAVVRLFAPYLKSKEEDPGVIVVDDVGRYVIPVLSGHVGGANACAEKVATILGAIPVLTTASDVGKTIPVDILGRELGWVVEAPKINITRVSAHVVNEEPIAFIQEAGSRNWWTRATPLPKNIHLFDRFEDVDLNRHKALLWVTDRVIEEALWQQLDERLVVYRPPLDKA